jgi:hypothetical protein
MNREEPPPHGPAAEDTPTLSWDLSWHPSTPPHYPPPELSGAFPSPSGPLRAASPYASPEPTQPVRSRRKGSRGVLLLVLLLGIALGAAGATVGPSLLSRIQASFELTPRRAAGAALMPQPTWTPTLTASPGLTMTPTPRLSPSPQGPTSTTIRSFTGSGSTNTAPITVPKRWQIAWQCNPTSWPGDQYELTITLHTTDGNVVSTALSTTCKATNISGVDPQYQAGTFYLQVSSAADWNIQIQVFQ